MSDITPIMGNDEWTLYKELYDVVSRAQKRGVSIQMCIGHVHALGLHLDWLTIGQIKNDQMPTREDPPSAAEHEPVSPTKE